MYKRYNLVIPAIILLIGVAVAAPPTSRGETVSRMSTVAKKTRELILPGDPARVDFVFGDIEAWVRADGNIAVEGWVTHRGLICADYQLGIRFGSGNPGCTNVTWLTEPVYVTKNKQCNNATVRHRGADNKAEIKKIFNRITCAERLIKCTGMCK